MKRLIDLLRAPDTVTVACRDPSQQREVARSALLAIAVGGAMFGMAVGSFRGGRQLVVAAVKIPLVMLVTACVVGPALWALAAAFGRQWRLSSTIALMLAAGARASLVLGALSAPLWLGIDLGLSYRATKLASALIYGAAGASGLALLVRGIGRERGRGGAVACFMAVSLVAGAQTAWVLRPYLGHPGDAVVPILVTDRAEGGVVGGLGSDEGHRPWAR
jgi:hypothetical protein